MSLQRTHAAAALLLAATLAGCGGSGAAPDGRAAIPLTLLREARPIGVGPRFHPPARGPIIGRCEPGLGSRFAVHIELFAQNRVVVVAAGIGVRGPTRRTAGRIVAARCFGAVTSLEPTGVILVRPGARLHLGTVFRAWGEPLSRHRAASFAAPGGGRVRAYVGGLPWPGAPDAIPLRPHAEIVVEVGPRVPPHARYTFPPGA